MHQRKLMCERGPLFYRLSVLKECLLRDMKDVFSPVRLARMKEKDSLPQIIKGHMSLMVRRLEGVEMSLQESKITNLTLAATKLDGIVIRPGETFSFWKTVGPCTKRRGYRAGLTITRGRLGSGVGGGVCQIANLIHYLVLHSPLSVTELHHHSDAIFPDDQRRVPFGTGTSISYKSSDYRFQNNTDQPVQLRIWVDGVYLMGELRAEKPFPCKYRLTEENHFFSKEPNGYYRNSQVYRLVTDSAGETQKELLLVNHSRVLYDPALIPTGELVTL